MLFARHDRAFASIGIASVRDLFVARRRERARPREPRSRRALPARRRGQRAPRPRVHRARVPGRDVPRRHAGALPRARGCATRRYDLDAAHPGSFDEIVDADRRAHDGALPPERVRARRPTRRAAEAQLGGLLQSGMLKRFESCWARVPGDRRADDRRPRRVPRSVGRRATVPSPASAARGGARRGATRPASPAWVERGARRRRRTRGRRASSGPSTATPWPPTASGSRAIRDRLGRARRRRPTRSSRSCASCSRPRRREKIAVFATYGDTVALPRRAPARAGRRARAGRGDRRRDDARRADWPRSARFARTRSCDPDYEPPDGEVDLLLSTDVLSEGQNLQQAQAVDLATTCRGTRSASCSATAA